MWKLKIWPQFSIPFTLTKPLSFAKHLERGFRALIAFCGYVQYYWWKINASTNKTNKCSQNTEIFHQAVDESAKQRLVYNSNTAHFTQRHIPPQKTEAVMLASRFSKIDCWFCNLRSVSIQEAPATLVWRIEPSNCVISLFPHCVCSCLSSSLLAIPLLFFTCLEILCLGNKSQNCRCMDVAMCRTSENLSHV